MSQDSNVSESTLSRPPLVLILCGLESLRQCLTLHSSVYAPPLSAVTHREWREDPKDPHVNLSIAAWTAAHNVRGFGKFLVIYSKEKGMAIEPSNVCKTALLSSGEENELYNYHTCAHKLGFRGFW